MELRRPPHTDEGPRPDRTVRILLVLNLLLLLGLGAWLYSRSEGGTSPAEAERDRQVASKLKAAGAFDEAASLFEKYLGSGQSSGEARAKIAYSLGTTYLDRGQYERALRWYYEAEALGAGSLAGEVGQKIVHCLERLGRHHAAKAALSSRVQLAADPVQRSEADPIVARIGENEIRRSEVERTLDDLPPEAARAFADPARRGELLKKYVADELIWRKATRLQYDDDPEVRQRHAALLKQLAVSRFVEREVLGKIEVDEADLKTYFEANAARYQESSGGPDGPNQAGQGAGDRPPLSFEQMRSAVERDYRIFKMQAAYNSMIEAELATDDVELFPERMTSPEGKDAP